MHSSHEESNNDDKISVPGSSEFFTSETVATVDASPSGNQETLSQRQHSSLDILVVDDSHSNRTLLAHLLTRQGHRCTQAGDGAVAVELVKRRLDASSGATSSASMDEETSPEGVFDLHIVGLRDAQSQWPRRCATDTRFRMPITYRRRDGECPPRRR